MKEKIKKVIKEIIYLNAKINPSILASSFTFYLVISIIPLFILISNILVELEIITTVTKTVFSNNFINVIILLIGLIWSSSRVIHNLLVISDLIYFDKVHRPRIKLRIRSIIYTIVFSLIIVTVITSFVYITYLKVKFIEFIILIDVLQFFVLFGLIIFMIALIYKYIIPTKVILKDAILISSIITIFLFISTIIYQRIVKSIILVSLYDLYLDYTSLIVTLFWLYFNCYIFLVGIGFIFIKNKYKES